MSILLNVIFKSHKYFKKHLLNLILSHYHTTSHCELWVFRATKTEQSSICSRSPCPKVISKRKDLQKENTKQIIKDVLQFASHSVLICRVQHVSSVTIRQLLKYLWRPLKVTLKASNQPNAGSAETTF